MSNKLPPHEARLEVLQHVHSVLIDLAPAHARELKALINEYPDSLVERRLQLTPELNKKATNILNRAMDGPSEFLRFLVLCQLALQDPEENIEKIRQLAKDLEGL